MIILKRNKFLFHNGTKYNCLIGKNGIRRLKKEGDWCTPTGKFTLGPVYYRKDKINRLETKLKCFTIKKNMYWEDNPNSKNYNSLSISNRKSNEMLYRKDNIYDIIIVINYNTKSVKPGYGSAIFIHIAENSFSPTKGCIALKKKDLVSLIKKLKLTDKLLVTF